MASRLVLKRKVGRGKPPKHTQFKKGEIGNKRGRPKGSKNLATLIMEGARDQVTVTVGREEATDFKDASNHHAACHKAAIGDLISPSSGPPGTEFLDAETGRQKQSAKRANARRDQNPGSERSEIPAETPYLASYRKRAVCGDWMVAQAVGYEPVSHVNSLLTGNFTGKTVIFGFGNRPLEPETPLPRHFGANSLIKLTGKRFRRTGILVAPTGNS